MRVFFRTDINISTCNGRKAREPQGDPELSGSTADA
jgi:hypothetical protein